MSLEHVAEAVAELAAKIALGNPRTAQPGANAKERVLVRNPSVPFDDIERGIVDRLSRQVETTDSCAVNLVQQTLRRAVVSRELITEDIPADAYSTCSVRVKSLKASRPPHSARCCERAAGRFSMPSGRCGTT
jgi:hypothetical protein